MGTVNKSWENFEIIMYNNGAKVLEDFKLTLEFEENYRGLNNDVPKFFRINHPVNVTDNYVVYRPNKQDALIVQKDLKSFVLTILAKYENSEIPIKWNFISRDFDKSGEIILSSNPNYIDEYSDISVYKEEDLREDEIQYEDILEYSSGIIL
ncbi:MAG: hypothetical protein A2057_02700 [Ignavibacteria bacterium GWA2_35_9]|nr:MAG: hypothetical protein A2057_02700 [Ignavibacteria bacterium GWA2_35_9]OGU48159.1 MAG: hypothetical protein A2000_07930 [Ignavibacteria bacterium GWB2_36_8]OGU49032.1 MAG: hypothetical protein A2080_03090 [Ignavibacteria bacterium GWC2_36_12]OGU95263.1 MAG: hypothetical protein A2330_05485 [Ignavibacteria bacterium RIFOXYB2_FULL_36_7]